MDAAADGLRRTGHAGRQPFDGQLNVAGETVAAPGEDAVRLVAALPERTGVGPLIGGGRDDKLKVRLIGAMRRR